MKTPLKPIDVDSLPPTMYLVMEVLAARHRLGERVWPFPYRLVTALRELRRLGLVELKSGVIARTVVVWLTDLGRASVLADDYPPPGPRNFD
jgi:hypothetical protein